MEALLRWQHPELDLVGPLEFLRLAEVNGRIMAIGEWVLKTACQQFAKWKVSSLGLEKITVNVSMRQLESHQFSFRVSQILQEANLTPQELVLEISETSLTPRLDLISKTLHMLKHLGVKVAIDDFGKGNLSLQNLKKFSFDYLKIDASLIQDMIQNSENEAIIKMIVALAESLKIETIAEGIETQAQKAFLEKFDCALMQGYLFSKPYLSDAFTPAVCKEIAAKI